MIVDKFYYRPLPDNLELNVSEIEGHGIFAVDNIEADMDLGPTHIKMPLYQGFMRTPLGGYLNHSDEPNCALLCVYDWDDYRVYHVFPNRDIEAGEELTLDYEI